MCTARFPVWPTITPKVMNMPWPWPGAASPISTGASRVKCSNAPRSPRSMPATSCTVWCRPMPSNRSTCAKSSRGWWTVRCSTSSRPCSGRHWCAGLPTCTVIRSPFSPTTASCSPKPRRKARTSSSWRASAVSRCCSCKTSPASWSARNMKPAASPSTARNW
ncbi:hypothetical protein D3C76_1004350 [compost metagenome]